MIDKLAVGITTAPRRITVDDREVDMRRTYLHTTVNALGVAGFGPTSERRGLIFWDGEVGEDDYRSLPDTWRHMFGPPAGGPWPAFRQLLRLMLDASPDAEALAIFQDDIWLTANLAGWLGWPAPPETIGVLSLYTAAPNHQRGNRLCGGWRELVPDPVQAIPIVRRGPDGVQERIGDRVAQLMPSFGALAVVMPRHAAERLLERPPGQGTKTRTDHWLGRFCLEHSLAYLCHSPSLCIHLGTVSTLSDHGSLFHRQAAAFATDAKIIDSLSLSDSPGADPVNSR